METVMKLKLKRNLVCLAIGLFAFVYVSPLQSQVVRDHRKKVENDPYAKLKIAAKKTTVQKSKMKPVKITVNDPNWQGTSKPKIKFVPFKLEDKKGRTIPANRKLTLKNGKRTTAQKAIKKMNEIEKKLNAQGYSLRNKIPKTISRIHTSNIYLDGRRAKAPKSIGPLKKGADLKKFMSLEKKVGIVSTFDNSRGKTITLKPYSMYTKSEKKKVNKYNFSKSSGGTLMAKKLIVPRRFQNFKIKRLGNLSAIYEHKPADKTGNWSFGNPKIFQASIEGTLHRYAKIYPFDPKHPEKNKSEFNVSATAKAKGTLINNSMDILNATCEFNAPADVSKKMMAKTQVKVLGTAIFNKTTFHAQEASFSKIHVKSFDHYTDFTVPIIAGFDFVGLIGVKGDIGFEYKGEIQRSIASVKAKPIVDLKAYGKAGVEFAKVFGGGIESELSFIKSNLELQAFSGIFNQNSEEIVVGINHYFGYDINILSGYLDAYAEVCAPEWVPFFGGDCKRITHNVLNWDGFKESGTIAKGTLTHTLANIAKYDAEPVMTEN